MSDEMERMAKLEAAWSRRIALLSPDLNTLHGHAVDKRIARIAEELHEFAEQVRLDTLEEAAKVADNYARRHVIPRGEYVGDEEDSAAMSRRLAAEAVAAAIRALAGGKG